MTLIATGRLAAFARAALLVFASAGLVSCGSGAVSGSAPVTDPTRITILPGTATLYSGLPTSFVVSGGTGSYIVSSSNQAVIPLAGSLPTNTFTVIPNSVTADTDVTLTVRDTGTTPVATSTLTVRPGTVGNDVTITPSSTQGGTCAPAICSGGDAEVSVQLSQGGQPLIGRGVRFEVVSGDFRFITSQPGNVETRDFTTTTVTDEIGRARARIRVTATANNQTALLRIVDLGSGASRSTSFTIAQATGTSPGFFASPSSITFSGPNDQECASSGSVDVYVYGGTPPYTISTVGAPFSISRDFVSFSGGSFSVLPRGVCVAVPGAPITIQDVTGRTTTVSAANVLGARAVPTLVVAPSTVTLSQCNSIATVSLGGGTGTYSVSSGSGSVIGTYLPGSNFFTIGRRPNTVGTTPVSVGVVSGSSAATVTVNVTGGALGLCDGSPLRTSPNALTLDTCGPVTVQILGGSGAYTASTNSAKITAIVSGSTLTIQRSNPSNTPDAGTAVFVSDGSASTAVQVLTSLSTPLTCP